jgi:hypothetical protein
MMGKNIRFLDNNFLESAVSVSSETDLNGFDVNDILDNYNFGKYRLTEDAVLSGYKIDIELQGELAPSSFSIIPDDNRIFYLTAETEVVIQASNSGFSVIEKEFTARHSRFGVFCDLQEDGIDNSYKYWRIWIKEFNRGTSELNESLDVKYIYLGDHVEVDSYNVSNGIGVQLEDRSVLQIAESGRVYANRKRPQLKITNLRFQYCSGADRIALQKLYYQVGKTENFLCVLDPSGVTEAEANELMRVMRFEKNPGQTHRVRDLFEQSFSLIEAL